MSQRIDSIISENNPLSFSTICEIKNEDEDEFMDLCSYKLAYGIEEGVYIYNKIKKTKIVETIKPKKANEKKENVPIIDAIDRDKDIDIDRDIDID